MLLFFFGRRNLCVIRIERDVAMGYRIDTQLGDLLYLIRASSCGKRSAKEFSAIHEVCLRSELVSRQSLPARRDDWFGDRCEPEYYYHRFRNPPVGPIQCRGRRESRGNNMETGTQNNA